MLINATSAKVLVLGSTGRLGSMLRRHWRAEAGLALWHGRKMTEGVDLAFDLLAPSALPQIGVVDSVVALAGIVPGAGDLSRNTNLAVASVRLGVELGARHVFVSSSAAVYGAGPKAFTETPRPTPSHPYGTEKLAMEDAALAVGAQLGIGVTALRIGNIAGADALLAQSGSVRVLDQFADGNGPVRSYLGPRAFADLLCALCACAQRGQTLPDRLNLALQGAVSMADLCHHAGLRVNRRPAPPSALAKVELDVSRLCTVLGRAPAELAADPAAIIADWRADLDLMD
ncbi:MAG: NAD-dependent epimerase/dehydratase family protein [Roseinatronobacter sp.]